MRNIYGRSLVLFMLVSVPSLAYGNSIWPSYLLASWLIYWPLIPLTILVEYPFYRMLEGRSWINALCKSLIANCVSATAGVVFLMFPYTAIELVKRATEANALNGQFTWLLDTLLPLSCFPIVNTVLEASVILANSSHATRGRCYLYLFCANILSLVVTAAFTNLVGPF